MATFPTDWVVFKQPEEQGGQITGYLMDAGAKRALAGAGVEVFDVSEPQRIEGTEPGTFSIRFFASGRSVITNQVIEKVLGSRSSIGRRVQGPDGRAARGQGVEDGAGQLRRQRRAQVDRAAELSGRSNSRACGRGSIRRAASSSATGGAASARAKIARGAGSAPNVPVPKCPHCQIAGRVARRQGRQARLLLLPEPSGSTPRKSGSSMRPRGSRSISRCRIAPAVGSGRSAAGAQDTPAPADRPCSICNVARSKHQNADHDWDDPGEP